MLASLLAVLLVIGVLPVTASEEEAFYSEVIALAQEGDAVAQNMAGVMYHIGGGVPQDYKQALAWYRKSAEKGNAKAQYNLGQMY